MWRSWAYRQTTEGTKIQCYMRLHWHYNPLIYIYLIIWEDWVISRRLSLQSSGWLSSLIFMSETAFVSSQVWSISGRALGSTPWVASWAWSASLKNDWVGAFITHWVVSFIQFTFIGSGTRCCRNCSSWSWIWNGPWTWVAATYSLALPSSFISIWVKSIDRRTYSWKFLTWACFTELQVLFLQELVRNSTWCSQRSC